MPYLIHRIHTDISTNKVIYQCYEGTKVSNAPIPSKNAAEIRRSEILWSAISSAQNDLRSYKINDDFIVVDYNTIKLKIEVKIIQWQVE